MDQKPLIGFILCLILLLSIAISFHGVGKTIDHEENTGSISNDDEIYFFTFAFVKGEYENCWKHVAYFRIWNSNFTNTMDVLGYKAWEHKFYSVKAFSVVGSHRIGFIGRHHCCIFAWGFGGVTVQT
jgi:hypothetical protein